MGLLYFKSSYMNSAVQLDWNEVATLQSQDQFVIRLASGAGRQELFNTFDQQSGDEKFAIGADSQGMLVNPA